MARRDVPVKDVLAKDLPAKDVPARDFEAIADELGITVAAAK